VRTWFDRADRPRRRSASISQPVLMSHHSASELEIRVLIMGPMIDIAEAIASQGVSVAVLWDPRSYVRRCQEMIDHGNLSYIPSRVQGHSPLSFLKRAIELAAIIKERRATIIQTSGIRDMLLAAMVVRGTRAYGQRPLVAVTSHNSYMWTSKTKSRISAMLIRVLADGVVTLASFLERRLVSLGVPDGIICTIPNPVDTLQFCPPDDHAPCVGAGCRPDIPTDIVCVGVLRPAKGQETLLRAAARVVRRHPQARFHFVGADYFRTGYESVLVTLAARLGLSGSVEFLGDVEHSAVACVLREADTVVCPSHMEMCPVSVIEALSCGRPTVASSVGGIPDLIDQGVNGMLVPATDEKALADALVLVLEDVNLRRSLGSKARASALERFSRPVVGSRYVRFYRGLVGQQEDKEQPGGMGGE
jgi:glycosyltransferase involved in cell wall biosynthesis